MEIWTRMMLEVTLRGCEELAKRHPSYAVDVLGAPRLIQFCFTTTNFRCIVKNPDMDIHHWASHTFA